MKTFLQRYKHAWTLLYAVVYLVWWTLLSYLTVDRFDPVHIPLDDRIPFCEWFIIPYYLWFPYILLVIAYFFFFAERREYYQMAGFLFVGMSIALLTYTIWPNGISFRPDLDALGRDNVLIDLTRFIYAHDPSTNCCPSIHCFNSIGVCIAINQCGSLRKRRVIRIGSCVLSLLICLSTVFVKQHSAKDVFWAFGLAAVMYTAAYVIPDRLAARRREQAV